jgi:aryl carrier-like protein
MTDRTSGPAAGLDLGGAPLEVVEAVWTDALGVDAVDPDAGFFDLGATSATMLGVVRVLRQRWPRLKVVDIFAHPTVAQLAAFLDDA